MTPRTLAPLLAAALTAVLAAPTALQACTCTNIPTYEQAFANASVVFAGRVTSIQPLNNPDLIGVIMTPLARWKGPLEAQVRVVTGANEGVCGTPFEYGLDYLVYATLVPDEIPEIPQHLLSTHLCVPSGPLQGHPALALLGPPLVPTDARGTTWARLKRLWR